VLFLARFQNVKIDDAGQDKPEIPVDPALANEEVPQEVQETVEEPVVPGAMELAEELLLQYLKAVKVRAENIEGGKTMNSEVQALLNACEE
jgi:hypothetical protein